MNLILKNYFNINESRDSRFYFWGTTAINSNFTYFRLGVFNSLLFNSLLIIDKLKQ